MLRGHQIPSKHLLEPKASRPGGFWWLSLASPVAASDGARLAPPHTSKLHWGQGWDHGAKTAKTDLLYGKVLGGDPGDGDLVVAKQDNEN